MFYIVNPPEHWHKRNKRWLMFVSVFRYFWKFGWTYHSEIFDTFAVGPIRIGVGK